VANGDVPTLGSMRTRVNARFWCTTRRLSCQVSAGAAVHRCCKCHSWLRASAPKVEERHEVLGGGSHPAEMHLRLQYLFSPEADFIVFNKLAASDTHYFLR